jgi:hypothetical protein
MIRGIWVVPSDVTGMSVVAREGVTLMWSGRVNLYFFSISDIDTCISRILNPMSEKHVLVFRRELTRSASQGKCEVQ